MEDKQRILDYLAKALRETERFYDLEALVYEAEIESVRVVFPGGAFHINVHLDNGWGMIKDVVNRIEEGL